MDTLFITVDFGFIPPPCKESVSKLKYQHRESEAQRQK